MDQSPPPARPSVSPAGGPTPKPFVERHKPLVDFLGSLSGIAAVIIGSAWAYYSLKHQEDREDRIAIEKAEKERLDAKRLQMTVKAEPLVSDGQKFVRVDTHLKNSGIVPITSSNRGCELTVVKVAKIDKNGEVYDLNSKKFDDTPSLVDRHQSLPARHDKKTGKNVIRYLIEPGLEYREVNLVRTTEPGLYFVRMRFFIGERGTEGYQSTMTDCTVVDMP